MAYLIDGHNLIPKIAGMSLRAIDDEDRLVETLQEFCRVSRQKVEVFFDQAPAGHAGRKTAGQVVIHYVRQGKTADQAILERLSQMGKAAKSWTVVTSDRQVRAGAHELGAALLTSEEFSARLRAARQTAQLKDKEDPAPPGPDEIDEWMRLFRGH